MKRILLAAAAALLAACASAPVPAPVTPAPAPAPEPPAPAPAPAARVITWEDALPVSVKSFYPAGDSSGTVTTSYDAQGRLVKQDKLNGNGVLVESRTGKAKGDQWRIAVVNIQTGETVSIEDLTYNAQFQVVSDVLLNVKEVPQAINEYTYDKEGRKVQWLTKTGTGALQAKTVYSYDAAGRQVKSEVFDAGGVLTNVFQNTFDAEGHLVASKGLDVAGAVVEQTNYTWKDGFQIKKETVKPMLRAEEYTYDGKNAPTTIVSSARGKVVERQTITYQWFPRTLTIAP